MMRIFLWIIAALFLCVALGYYQLKQAIEQPLTIEQTTLVDVPKGMGFNQLCQSWQQKKWLKNCWGFALLARLDPTFAKIKSGVYQLSPSSALSAFKKINQGQVHQFSFTIIEGESLRQTLAKLAQAPYVANALKWGDKLENKPLNSELEGWFFPDTYHYYGHQSAAAILTKANQKMRTELKNVWQKRDKNTPLQSPYEALILASIIEKETAQTKERPLIGSVFVNRLNKGMRLQTDPTVIYGIGEAFDGNITRQHLRQYTPYNTYKINGLPPTPIAMPSAEALLAAVAPVKSDYFYFVAKGNGEHQFSRNLAAHNKAVRQYQLKRKNDS